MKAEIITIGDEILIGQIVNTNATFISKALNAIGIDVKQITVVGDNTEDILKAFSEASRRNVQVVITTGGLGPTKDDITKKTICQYFNDTMLENTEVLEHVRAIIRRHDKDRPLLDSNRQQALVPRLATVLFNKIGTAPGMWFEKKDVVYIVLPGVPVEMKTLVEEEVVPRLKLKFNRPHIIHKTVITYGIPESLLAEKVKFWEEGLPEGIKLAYLPAYGKVRLRLSARGLDRNALQSEVDRQIESLRAIIGDAIRGLEEDGDIEYTIGRALLASGKTIAFAESLTAGGLSKRLALVPGASSYYKGGVVCYATQTKTSILKVSEELISKYSVVSAEVAECMAENARALFRADYAVATTGQAGPTKGDSDAPIGTVFIAVASPGGVFSEKFDFGTQRESVIEKAINKALERVCESIHTEV